MRILQLTVHLFPNVGGVETHLKDLLNSLIKRNLKVFVLAYQPLSIKADWEIFEKDKNLAILRIPWIGGFFEKLVSYPFLEFIYLAPGLFIVTPFILFLFRPNVIHAHGLIASVSAVFWGKIFRVRIIISLHSFYSFPKKGFYRNFVQFLLSNSDFVLSLSKKSNEEVRSLGLDNQKSGKFTYWIDLKRFKRVSDAKKKLGWNKFTVLFVGRLIKEKGVDVLLQSVKSWDKNINLVIIGAGPKADQVSNSSRNNESINFIGKIDQDKLPLYYSASDCVIVPSISEEGFGRVILESLACGTPVIAANKGAISEAMDETVGELIEVNSEDIKKAVEYFYETPNKLKKLSQNARQFAQGRYSERNVNEIIKAYKT